VFLPTAGLVFEFQWESQCVVKAFVTEYFNLKASVRKSGNNDSLLASCSLSWQTAVGLRTNSASSVIFSYWLRKLKLDEMGPEPS